MEILRLVVAGTRGEFDAFLSGYTDKSYYHYVDNYERLMSLSRDGHKLYFTGTFYDREDLRELFLWARLKNMQIYID